MSVNPGPPEGRPEPRSVTETPHPGPPTRGERDAKDAALDAARAADPDGPLTTDQGVRVDDTDNSLAAGERGPTLLEDFQLREKLTHFDHERIPERVVHARGAGAYGFFEPYASLAEFTCADFLQQAGRPADAAFCDEFVAPAGQHRFPGRGPGDGPERGKERIT